MPLTLASCFSNNTSNPKETDEVKIEGDKLVACPPLPQLQTVTLKVLRYRFDRERFIVTSGT